MITTDDGDTVIIERALGAVRDERTGEMTFPPIPFVSLNINEGQRDTDDPEGDATAHLSPNEARQLAAALVALADEIEGEQP